MAVRQTEMVTVLQRVPLFTSLTQRQLRGLARECSEVRYEVGEQLLRELDWGQHMIVIADGTAEVQRNGKAIATVGPGDAIGEMSLLDDEPRSATVVATEPVTGVVLYRTAFRRVLQEHPSMCMKLLLAQTKRLREADRRAAAVG
jgi:CRP/FNR family transcriptional regulator, cyclic AMP receptor protein